MRNPVAKHRWAERLAYALCSLPLALLPSLAQAQPAPECQTIRRHAAGEPGVAGNVEDTFLSGDSPGWAAGLSSPTLWTGLSSGQKHNRALLRFDVSSVPVCAQVTSATLSLTFSWNEHSSPISVHPVLAAWSEATTTANSFPADGLAAPVASFLSGTGGVRTVDVTPTVAAWIGGALPPFGFLIDEPSVHSHIVFSSEVSAPSGRPSLLVCFLDNGSGCAGPLSGAGGSSPSPESNGGGGAAVTSGSGGAGGGGGASGTSGSGGASGGGGAGSAPLAAGLGGASSLSGAATGAGGGGGGVGGTPCAAGEAGAGGGGGAGAGGADEDGNLLPADAVAAGQAPARIDSGACATGHNWIGTTEADHCPEVFVRTCAEGFLVGLDAPPPPKPGCSDHQWVRCPLFADPQGEEIVPTGLGRYCAYAMPTGPNSYIEPSSLKVPFPDIQEADHPGPLVPMASFSADYRSLMKSQFLAQVWGSPTPPPGAPGIAPGDRVRVAIVDGAPYRRDGTVPHDTSGHGELVARLVNDVVCPPGGACGGHATTELALPWIPKPVDPTRLWEGPKSVAEHRNGGFYGEQADAAVAIHWAVETWRKDRANDPDNGPRHLVVNLSVGWNPQSQTAGRPVCDLKPSWDSPDLDPDADPVDPRVRVIFDALRYAACRGALVIAAAGNDRGGPAPPAHGAVCPAVWSDRPAPTAEECAVLFGGSAADWAPPSGSLLYRVGGVDYADRPIVETRIGSVSNLAALAILATAGDDAALPAPLTGTSVAAAVTSGVAAAVWARLPNVEDGAAIMDILYDSGVDLTGAPGFAGSETSCADPQGCGACADEASCFVHRVSLCDALQSVGEPYPCSGAPASSSTPELPAALTALLDEESTLAGIEPVAVSAEAQTYSIPGKSYPRASLWSVLHPQPRVPSCPDCVVSLPDQCLYYEINPAYNAEGIAGRDVQDLTLTLIDANGYAVSFLLDAGPLDAAKQVFGLQGLIPPQVSRAFISARVDDNGVNGSISEQVLVQGP